jgi:uroporphyrinogen decarboxylase
MHSKERVIRTLRFQQPDRIPVDLWVLPALSIRYGDALQELLDRNVIDIARAPYNDPTFDERHYRIGSYRDVWGSVWKNAQEGIIGEVKEYPLDDYEKLKDYRSPITLLKGGFEETDDYIEAHGDKFILGGWISIFERMQFLRGTENLYMDIADDCDELYLLRDIVTDFYREYLRQWLEHDVDAICFGDDWGSQRSLLVSPDSWRRVFRPVYKELIDNVKAKGKYVFFHSDGYIMELYQEFIDLGVDAINSQLWCMGVENVAERFAGRTCFWGELSRQETLPHGTPDDIRKCAEIMKKNLFINGGGLIGQSEAGKDVSLENIEAVLNCW